MRTFRFASTYKRDLKRIGRRNYDLARLAAVLDLLAGGQTMPPERRDHPLRGVWQGCRECHVAPDWLLIYQLSASQVLLVRTGTHADLFKS